MEKYQKFDITNMGAAEVIKRFGAVSNDAVIKNECGKVFIYIPIRGFIHILK